jgi:hypothetical protein
LTPTLEAGEAALPRMLVNSRRSQARELRYRELPKNAPWSFVALGPANILLPRKVLYGQVRP